MQSDFASTLARLGLSQAEFRRFVERLSGHKLSPTTTSRWARGDRATSPEAIALLALIENPKPLLSLRQTLRKA